MDKFDHIFIVMDLGFSDFKKLLNSVPNTEITEMHIITLLYNQLCAINFLHTLNIVHRDLKPANFLLNENCSVMICDFGLARVLPKKSKAQKFLTAVKKKGIRKSDGRPSRRKAVSPRLVQAKPSLTASQSA